MKAKFTLVEVLNATKLFTQQLANCAVGVEPEGWLPSTRFVAKALHISERSLQNGLLKYYDLRMKDILAFTRILVIIEHCVVNRNNLPDVANLSRLCGFRARDGISEFTKQYLNMLPSAILVCKEARIVNQINDYYLDHDAPRILRSLSIIAVTSWPEILYLFRDRNGARRIEPYIGKYTFAERCEALGKGFIECARREGKLDFEVSCVLDPKGNGAPLENLRDANLCETVVCHGGWASVLFGTPNSYEYGALLIARYLGFVSTSAYLYWVVEYGAIWGTSCGEKMFDSEGYLAFGISDPDKFTLNDLGQFYVDLGTRARAATSEAFHVPGRNLTDDAIAEYNALHTPTLRNVGI